MAGISGILGNASGLDSEALIQAILAARQQAIDSVQERINKEDDKKEGYLAVQSSLANMQEIARRLHNGTAFNASIIQSSNASKLLATGTTTSLEGTFSFFAHSLASVSQYVSNGFFNTASAKVTNTPGTMTVEIGNARLYRPTDLDALNGSTGIDRGKIRITDDTGTSTVIDLTNVVTIDDVIDKINSNGTVQVEARVNDMIGSGLLGQGLVIENASGAGTIKVENVGFGSTATSLGIEGTNAMGVIVGTRINSIGVQTSLASLNDGRGVGDGMSTLGILTITGSGAAINVDLTDAKTMGDVVTLINAQAGTVTASLSGTSIKLSDAGMPASITVSGLSATMDSLGIDSAMLLNMGGGDFLGRPVIASLNSVLTSSLAGVSGTGLPGTLAAASSFDITDSMGGITTVSFSGREDIYEILDQINNPIGPAANVLARIDKAGTGIEIVDKAGGAGSLTITDTVGTLAAAMGLAGVHADGLADAGNLNFKHFHGNRKLTEFGFDFGPQTGSIDVTLADGSQQRIDISLAETVGDVIDALNTLPTLSVSIGPYGDGLRIVDSSGGTSPLTFRDSAGKFAKALGLRGTFDFAATIDRRLEYDIAVDAGDSLNKVVEKIQALEVDVIASIVDDGSGANPYRLSLTATEPGVRNDINVRTDIDSFRFDQTSVASDSIMLYGNSTGSADPVVVRSITNTFKKVLEGVTLDLLGVSDEPINVTVTRDLEAVSNDVNELVDTFNAMKDRIDELTDFNIETLEGGPLLGDNTLRGLEFSLIRAYIDLVEGLPLGASTLASIGIEIDNDGRLTIDNEILLEALENRSQEVQDIFANSGKITPDTKFKNWNNGDGIKASDSGADLRITFADASADLLIDVSSYTTLDELLDAINADARITAEISADGRRLIFTDNTVPTTGTFSIRDENNSGTALSLGLTSTIAQSGVDFLETKKISLNTELGVARRIDNLAQEYIESEGLIDQATENIDERIKRLNEQIETINERIERERERLERQFAAMEATLAESQQMNTVLQQQAESSAKNNEK